MTRLRIYDEKSGDRPITETKAPDEIAEALKRAGVRFERWEARHSVAAGDDQAAILEAYRADVDRLMREGGYRTAEAHIAAATFAEVRLDTDFARSPS